MLPLLSTALPAGYLRLALVAVDPSPTPPPALVTMSPIFSAKAGVANVRALNSRKNDRICNLFIFRPPNIKSQKIKTRLRKNRRRVHRRSGGNGGRGNGRNMKSLRWLGYLREVPGFAPQGHPGFASCRKSLHKRYQI